MSVWDSGLIIFCVFVSLIVYAIFVINVIFDVKNKPGIQQPLADQP